MSQTDAKPLSKEEAEELIAKRGYIVKETFEQLFQFDDEAPFATIYIIHLVDSAKKFIVRNDTGEVYDSQFFWKNFSYWQALEASPENSSGKMMRKSVHTGRNLLHYPPNEEG